MEGNGGAFVWNACDPDARIRSVKQLQPFVQVFHADVGVAVLLGGGNGLNVRDHLKTDSIVYNTDFQLAVVSLYDLDDQMAFPFLGSRPWTMAFSARGWMERQGISQESTCSGIWMSQEILSSKRIC